MAVIPEPVRVDPQYRWLSVSARTGRIIADLPGLVIDQVSSVLGGETTTTGSLPLFDRTPARWDEAILEGAACLILVDGSDDDRPIWGGPVISTVPDESDAVALSLASWEWFLRGFYIGDKAFTGVQQTQIIAQLVAQFVQDGSHPLIVEAAASSTLRDDSYADADDKTALDALTSCMNLSGGAEWTVSWRHLSDPERYVPVMTIADRIGIQPAPGLGTAATFAMPGAVTTFSWTRSYASGDGANSIIATSNPDPDEPRPQSPPQLYVDPLRPTVQYRWTPSTSIIDVATLTSHAAARLVLMQNGSRALTLTASTQAAPRLGHDWNLGDVIGFDLTAPSVPNGLSGTARALGWSLDLAAGQVSPVLGVPNA